MAVIGNRIRQILRILNADGQCTTRQVFDRLGTVNATTEVSLYLRRAIGHGFVQRIDANPPRYEITQAGREVITEVRGVQKKPVQVIARGPSSIWDFAARYTSQNSQQVSKINAQLPR